MSAALALYSAPQWQIIVTFRPRAGAFSCGLLGLVFTVADLRSISPSRTLTQLIHVSAESSQLADSAKRSATLEALVKWRVIMSLTLICVQLL